MTPTLCLYEIIRRVEFITVQACCEAQTIYFTIIKALQIVQPAGLFRLQGNFEVQKKKYNLAPGKPVSLKKSDIMKEPVIRETAKKQAPDEIADLHENNFSLRWIILIPFVIVLGVLAAIYRQGEATDNTEQPVNSKAGKQGAITGGEASVKNMVRNNIRLYVKAESNNYEHSRLGGINNLAISVSNPTDYTLDKVRVKIMYVKANGSIWETKYEDFLTIKPNTKVTHKIADTKRGTSIKYEISSVKSKSLGLS